MSKTPLPFTMQSWPSLAAVALCLATRILYGAITSETGAPELERLVKIFPSLYWHASNACMRETSRLGGQIEKHEDFVKRNRAVVRKLEEVEMAGRKVRKAELQLLDPDAPKEHWVFEFVYRDSHWSAYTAFKYPNKEERFELYEGDIFLGSMKPYIQKGIDAVAEGKDLESVFKAK